MLEDAFRLIRNKTHTQGKAKRPHTVALKNNLPENDLFQKIRNLIQDSGKTMIAIFLISPALSN